MRVRRAERGHFGDVKLLEDGVSEMRIDCGPGYRVYFAREGRMVFLLLCGGDKSTQPADIRHAKSMWADNQKGTVMSKVKTARFDASHYLDSEEMIAEYLNAALEEGDADLLLAAIADIAKARGIAKVAADAGLGRESLYKTLAPGSKPRMDTVFKLLRALGVKLNAVPEGVAPA